MASKFLPVFIGNALGDNEELLPAFAAGKGGLKEALRFCQNFRVAGIGSLLLSGTSARLHECLHASARAFVFFSRASEETKKLTSRAAPFFDAVACGDDESARELSRFSPASPDKDREYEEDFLFVRFLMDHFFLERTAQDGQVLLSRYEKCLEGTTDARLLVCQALLAADGDAFDAALTQMMEEREVRYRRLAEKETEAEEVLATEAYVSIEGLALVRLAVRAGLKPQEDYLFIPSTALELPRLRYRADSWKHLML
ncbi:hypothetical protein MXAN_7129 [Myxococcus xanthus DK 1622]|uniref:Uncharacterized protein n=1 Tax=Myxococcus xanthus (strain DK1622) TaxID=246197 RepID=Q1CWI1_MYXXD|nr:MULTISPECIES: Imm49 family immunity protein [Myxococcus]ABF87293.1 hypothetical protein MXAN_7129 [Myxococcus xanthus DK 1622]NOJ52706.1 immunity 49 family protein [Myxococcus xanthus]QPM79396.1 immunity 49 family protein [Myxococcus xanthus]QVW68476.1 immunity 49 family protein [Myxococcus xanthus DZ2]QZZ54735.1 hypothetical protein MyxoNM_36420 [Myxococcus xanthus]